ncbi:TetR family transcriptional regulator C-terminal domain-containing protein [Falsochrobactrum sp. TDYN1]|uniref:TetR family transcriptional regulator C-terminal domain-containing protein n=1 Tax=Falsochrobactrum tianjinense TaxID=2706015 RepID=A0A949PN81_9HYPH|nr:TetR family transcriptional regulator C-terminal domain-containing protein [Falsochrobactrum sp. TDYN1]MBV2143139.1 TetR family transcriptional regulator C-terminal domain-containing protein [Falsochrobactrum sp. TDYN1]
MSSDNENGGTELTGRDRVLGRRQRILDAIRAAAIDEFAKKGLVGASTQGIAQRAGLTKPQLHYYISSKEELYEDIIVFILDEWEQIFLGATTEEDPAKVIRQYIRKKLEYSQKNPKASRLFTTEIANGAPYLRRHWAKHVAATHNAVKLIQAWVDTGRIRPVDPLLLQIHIWAVTQHYADFETQVRSMMKLDWEEPLDLERIEREVSTLFLRACGLE